MAAAPDEILPNFPEPLHVFSKYHTNLDVTIDKKKFIPQHLWKTSAPYRVITVRDAFSDLPPIPSNSNEVEIAYHVIPMINFQKNLRMGASNMVVDHISKKMSPLVQSRIEHIPKTDGADWRDLPNKIVTLNDGSSTQPLYYRYFKGNNGSSFDETLTGVCSCKSGSECDAMDIQTNTLIPWSLAHSADMQNNWPGKYGRLSWIGCLGTIPPNPEPLGEEGRILHPEEARIISVRECARSQGFPDRYRFCGSVLDKYRQVGNAFPPPLALAIGREIIKSLKKNEQMKTKAAKVLS